MGEGEISRLKTWLQSPEAELFIESLEARSYLATLESGELLKSSISRQNKGGIKAEMVAAGAGILDELIKELRKMAEDTSDMVKLSILPPVAPTQPEEENPNA